MKRKENEGRKMKRTDDEEMYVLTVDGTCPMWPGGDTERLGSGVSTYALVGSGGTAARFGMERGAALGVSHVVSRVLVL